MKLKPDGVSANRAARHVAAIYLELKKLYPGKEVVISETGWPSQGPPSPHGSDAVPSAVNEQMFWATFLPLATLGQIQFGAFEAFDEPSKSNSVMVENNWGLLTSNENFKTSIHSLLATVGPRGACVRQTPWRR
jgi:exo-beta-1,3-glucanase (GH17 family)